jgi:glutathione S-transferase
VSEDESRPILFADRGCPFAHRVLATLVQLGVPFERREAEVGGKPRGLERHSPSGRVPILVHDGLVLAESRVTIEYLAERYGLPGALPLDLATRTLHRHAMAVADDQLVPSLLRRGPALSEPRLGEALAALAVATETVPPRAHLLALHLAPLWVAFRSWQPTGAVTRAIEARPALGS